MHAQLRCLGADLWGHGNKFAKTVRLYHHVCMNMMDIIVCYMHPNAHATCLTTASRSHLSFTIHSRIHQEQ